MDELMQILSATSRSSGPTAPFFNYKHCSLIDAIDIGDVLWQIFICRYNGNVADDSPSWMKQGYEVHYRGPLQVVRNILSNTEFNGKMDYAPYDVKINSEGSRQFHDLMSANWAHDQVVCNSSSRSSCICVSNHKRCLAQPTDRNF